MSGKKQQPNITEEKAKQAAEREKRLADALRDNLKRRRPVKQKANKTKVSDRHLDS